MSSNDQPSILQGSPRNGRPPLGNTLRSRRNKNQAAKTAVNRAATYNALASNSSDQAKPPSPPVNVNLDGRLYWPSPEQTFCLGCGGREHLVGHYCLRDEGSRGIDNSDSQSGNAKIEPHANTRQSKPIIRRLIQWACLFSPARPLAYLTSRFHRHRLLDIISIYLLLVLALQAILRLPGRIDYILFALRSVNHLLKTAKNGIKSVVTYVWILVIANWVMWKLLMTSSVAKTAPEDEHAGSFEVLSTLWGSVEVQETIVGGLTLRHSVEMPADLHASAADANTYPYFKSTPKFKTPEDFARWYRVMEFREMGTTWIWIDRIASAIVWAWMVGFVRRKTRFNTITTAATPRASSTEGKGEQASSGNKENEVNGVESSPLSPRPLLFLDISSWLLFSVFSTLNYLLRPPLKPGFFGINALSFGAFLAVAEFVTWWTYRESTRVLEADATIRCEIMNILPREVVVKITAPSVSSAPTSGTESSNKTAYKKASAIHTAVYLGSFEHGLIPVNSNMIMHENANPQVDPATGQLVHEFVLYDRVDVHELLSADLENTTQEAGVSSSESCRHWLLRISRLKGNKEYTLVFRLGDYEKDSATPPPTTSITVTTPPEDKEKELRRLSVSSILSSRGALSDSGTESSSSTIKQAWYKRYIKQLKTTKKPPIRTIIPTNPIITTQTESVNESIENDEHILELQQNLQDLLSNLTEAQTKLDNVEEDVSNARKTQQKSLTILRQDCDTVRSQIARDKGLIEKFGRKWRGLTDTSRGLQQQIESCYKELEPAEQECQTVKLEYDLRTRNVRESGYEAKRSSAKEKLNETKKKLKQLRKLLTEIDKDVERLKAKQDVMEEEKKAVVVSPT